MNTTTFKGLALRAVRRQIEPHSMPGEQLQ